VLVRTPDALNVNLAPSGKHKERVEGVTAMTTTGLAAIMEMSLLRMHPDLLLTSLSLGLRHMVAGISFGYALIHL
jgi:hypothetical protein